MHKRTGGNLNVLEQLMGDLWFLAAPTFDLKQIYQSVGKQTQEELQLLSAQMNQKGPFFLG